MASWPEYFGVTHETDEAEPKHRAGLVLFYCILFLCAAPWFYSVMKDAGILP